MSELKNKEAFVIRFSSDANFEHGGIKGKVEHVASYESKWFQSLEELLAFISGVLEKVRAATEEQL
jgi:hypothetical protein